MRRRLTNSLFVLPALLMSIAFFLAPLGQSFWISLHDWPVLGEAQFLGLGNYKELLGDRYFWDSLWFTTKYTLIVTPMIFITAFILASLVRQDLPFVGVFRSAYFIPVVLSMIAASTMWSWIYNDQYGILNFLLMKMHLISKPVVWMAKPKLSLPAVCIMVTWKTAGFNMLILLSGLQSIPEEIYEAASVDGASRWQKIWRITLPLLRPTLGLALVVSVIGSYLAFDQFFVMTRGGPCNQTTPVAYWIYNTSFAYFRQGYGSAMSFVLLAILVALSILQMRILRKQYDY